MTQFKMYDRLLHEGNEVVYVTEENPDEHIIQFLNAGLGNWERCPGRTPDNYIEVPTKDGSTPRYSGIIPTSMLKPISENENPVSSRPEPKFKEGQLVKICDQGKDKGWGYLNKNSGFYSPIKAIAGEKLTAGKPVWNEIYNEWFYVYGLFSRNELIAEHALSLVQDKPVESNFKVGDWVVVLPEDEYYADAKKEAQQINAFKKDGFKYELDDGYMYNEVRAATPTEIALANGKGLQAESKPDFIEEAKRRGFKEGVQYRSFLNEGGRSSTQTAAGTLRLYDGRPGFGGNHGYLCKEGEWAEIITPVSLTQPGSSPKFKVGDKVKIPKTKSTGDPLSDSQEIKRAKKLNQDYLFVTTLPWGNVQHYLLAAVNRPADGDYFLEKDLELYTEPVAPAKNPDILTEYNGYKVGDWVTVTKEPKTWIGSIGGSCPIGRNLIFPMYGQITKIVKDDADNYGFSMGCYGFSFKGCKDGLIHGGPGFQAASVSSIKKPGEEGYYTKENLEKYIGKKVKIYGSGDIGIIQEVILTNAVGWWFKLRSPYQNDRPNVPGISLYEKHFISEECEFVEEEYNTHKTRIVQKTNPSPTFTYNGEMVYPDSSGTITIQSSLPVTDWDVSIFEPLVTPEQDYIQTPIILSREKQPKRSNSLPSLQEPVIIRSKSQVKKLTII